MCFPPPQQVPAGSLRGRGAERSQSDGVGLEKFFFSGWESLFRTLVIGVLAYVALVVLLRVSGNRTLSKMNAFDLIVTVALGSTLATVLLNKNVALAEGTLAFALLIGLQFVVTWTSVRVQWVRRLVTGDPSMLLYRGDFVSGSLRSARVTRDEVRAAIRSAGLCKLEDVEAVVLETDGSFNVIKRTDDTCAAILSDVRGIGALAGKDGG